ncbi:MAG TPA: hypothetical protein VGA66_14145 [Mycobacterium sp.]|jgi:nicotinamidase-related amidase
MPTCWQPPGKDSGRVVKVRHSALDAYVRHFSFVVPPDCVANIDPELGDAALTMMHKNMHAEIVPAGKCQR